MLRFGHFVIHLPGLLGSAGITPFRGIPADRYYEPSDSCPSLLDRAGLPGSLARPSSHSVSNHPMPSHRRFNMLPLSATGFPRSRVRASLFASKLTTASGRIEFAMLRTGHSPPVASHPASWRRTARMPRYLRLRAGEHVSRGGLSPPGPRQLPGALAQASRLHPVFLSYLKFTMQARTPALQKNFSFSDFLLDFCELIVYNIISP